MKALEERIPVLDQDEQHDLVHLMSRFNGVQRNYNLGVMTESDYQVETNRVRLAIWDLIRDLKEVPTPREAGGEAIIGDPESLYNKVKKHAAEQAPADPPPPVPEDTEDSAAHLFISYAREDREFVDELIIALASLSANGWINSWTDSEIQAGQEWRPTIEANLRMADIVIYVVSADFLASEFIRTRERVWAEAERERRGITILPVIARPTTWELEAFSKYNVVPEGPDGDILPISRWEDEDEAYLTVVEALIEILKERIDKA